MELVTVTLDNLDHEHICCAISDNQKDNCVVSKKAWMRERIKEGLVFTKVNVRGKAFIEYIPAQYAWEPIEAENVMHINCFWIAGKYAGQGYANILLQKCIDDAISKGKDGISIIASGKKRGFLPDASYMKYKGFQIVDEAYPFFVLYYLPLKNKNHLPTFKECAKKGRIEEQGMVLYYSNQCPFTAKYVPKLEKIAQDHALNLSVHKIETRKQAQTAPTPFTTYSFYYQGEFVTNEIMSEKKFEKFLLEKVL